MKTAFDILTKNHDFIQKNGEKLSEYKEDLIIKAMEEYAEIKIKRFKAARSAMQGLTSNPELNRVPLDDIVKRSIQYADELLKQIEL